MLNGGGPEERTVVIKVLNNGPQKSDRFCSAFELCSDSMSCLDGYIGVGDRCSRRHVLLTKITNVLNNVVTNVTVTIWTIRKIFGASRVLGLEESNREHLQIGVR